MSVQFYYGSSVSLSKTLLDLFERLERRVLSHPKSKTKSLGSGGSELNYRTVSIFSEDSQVFQRIPEGNVFVCPIVVSDT